MNITPPHSGNNRFHSNDIDPANRNASTAQSASTNVSTNVAPTTIAPVEAAATVEKPAFDSGALAKTILSFVQQRLTQAKQDGASKEELTTLLAQAYDGAEAGFNQAVSELKDRGALTDTLSGGISTALQKVDSGFTDLAKQFGLNDSASSNSAPVGSTTTATTKSSNTAIDTQTNSTPAPQTGTLSQLAAAYKTSFSSKQSVDLVVQTADGDTVRLQLGVKQKQSFGAAYQADANGQQLSAYSREKSSGRLNISVEGNLDADEMQALGDLLNQVGDLADSFFGGDMDAAWQKAGALDLSNPELSAMSLDLRSEVTTRSKIAAYAAVQSLTDDPSATSGAPSTTSAPASLGLSDLVDALSSLMPKASLAKNPANLLKEMLAAQLAAMNQENNPLMDFTNRLLDILGADASSETSDTPQDTVPAPSTDSATKV